MIAAAGRCCALKRLQLAKQGSGGVVVVVDVGRTCLLKLKIGKLPQRHWQVGDANGANTNDRGSEI